MNSNNKAIKPSGAPRRAGFQRNGPPMYTSQPVRSRMIRFKSDTSSSRVDITSGDLISACGVVATTATTANRVCKAVRLRKIEIWGTPPPTGSSSHVIVDWAPSSQSYGNDSAVSGTSLSPITPVYVTATPPRNALASFWLSAGGATQDIVTITCPDESIMDFHFDYVLADGVTEVTANIAVVSATVGQYYIKGMGGGVFLATDLASIA